MDTLCTVVSDTDLAPRLHPMLPEIVRILNQMTTEIKYPNYFDFLSDFCKYYASELSSHICNMMQTVIQRVFFEQKSYEQKANDDRSKETFRINKCWNLIRLIIERPDYAVHLATFEEMLKPLFAFIQKPKEITFEDEIVLCLKQLITKNKKISPVSWECFKNFPALLEKNKGTFGVMFECINTYLLEGKEDMNTTNRAEVTTLAKMASQALFWKGSGALAKNTEGAILLQLMFQTMRNTTACHEIFAELLGSVKQRMQEQPMSNMLKKHVLGIFLSTVIYNRQMAMQYFEHQNLTLPLLEELIKLYPKFRHQYERQLFVISISELLQNETLPENLRGVLVKLIETLINIQQQL